MKKLIVVVLIVMFVVPLSGCTAARREARRLKRQKNAEYYRKIQGWEYVRIEKKVPCKDCTYIIQEACGEKDASKCYNWYKQEAKYYGGNTVVVIEDIRSPKAYGSSSIGGSSNNLGAYISGSGNFQAYETISALADYYICPPYKVGQAETTNPR